MRIFAVRIDDVQRVKLERIAHAKRVSCGAVIRWAIDSYLSPPTLSANDVVRSTQLALDQRVEEEPQQTDEVTLER